MDNQSLGEFAKGFADLAISLTKLADGYAIVELGSDAIQLIGEDSMPEYAIQLNASAMEDYAQAMNLRVGEPRRDELINKSIAKENEALRIATETLYPK